MDANHPSLHVVVSWAGTVIAVDRLAPGEAFTVGPLGTFCCDDPSIPEPAFALVARDAQRAHLRPAPGMRLVVDGGADDAGACTLEPGQGGARLVLGALAFDVRFERAAAVATSRPPPDARLLTLSGAALALQAAVVAALLLAPTNGASELPLPTSMETRARFVVPARPAPVVAAPRAQATTQPVRHAVRAEAALARSAVTRPRAGKAGTPRSAAGLAADALASLGLGGPAERTLPGLGGGLQGLQAASGADLGAGGLGVRPTGPGGAEGSTVGVGGIRLRAGDPPGGTHWGLVARERRPSATIVLDRAQHTDGLSREEIQRVIARALPRIKYCYERELGAAPALEGKVTSTFTIASSGAVAASTLSHTLSTPSVATCVDRVVRTLTFPQPHGGGQVVVTYPFVFTLAGN